MERTQVSQSVFVLKFFMGWNLWAYVGIAATVLAVVSGYAYYKGSISRAEEVGRLNTEIVGLKKDIREADAKTLTCQGILDEQNLKIQGWKDEADLRIAEAVKAAQAARVVAQGYKDKARELAQRTPSKSCDEAAQRFRQQLEGERK